MKQPTMPLFYFSIERPKQNNLVALEMLHQQVSLKAGAQIFLEKYDIPQFLMSHYLFNEGISIKHSMLYVDNPETLSQIDENGFYIETRE